MKSETDRRADRVQTLGEMLENSGQAELLRRYFGDSHGDADDMEEVAETVTGLAYGWDVDRDELDEAVRYVLDNHRGVTRLTEEEHGILWLAGWYRERLMPLFEQYIKAEIAGRTIDRLVGAGLLERYNDDVTAYRITEAGVQACREYEKSKCDG